LDRIVHSVPFQHSPRRQRFLEFIVNETLAGRSLKGYDVALEVFDRPETFDPAVDPVVRVEAGRLREKLREYYGADGQSDPSRIDLPKGTYTPHIEFRHEDAPRSARQKVSPTQAVSSTIPSVAVLPFDDLSADQNLGYLGDGVAEDIITALSRFPDLVVVARSSSFTYQHKAVEVRQVGKDLGVGYVVEGSVRKDGDKIRIASQLIDTKDGEHVWAERFDRSGIDPWAIQDEVTGMIVSAMTGEAGALKQAQYRQAWGKDATTLDEYDYYLRGHDQFMKYIQGDKKGMERSGEIWREGLAKFPSSPLLNVKLGWYHMQSAVNFLSDDPPADVRKAGELARQVLANEHISPQVARLANWLMSYVLVQERDFDGALAAANKTVALGPYDTFVLSDLMIILVQVGRPDQALQWADRAAARDPALGWCYNYGRGWAYLALGRFGEAVDALRQTEYNDAHLLLAVAYVRLGRLADARAEVGKMMKINPAITVQAWRLAYSFRDPAILDRYALDLVQSGLPKT
ncbi:MAG: tetratricopeptide repeat protein, partial [Methyloceanibacter sp.]